MGWYGWVLWAMPMAVTAQSVPLDYFAGIVLEAEIPTQTVSGEVILLKGRLDDASIPAMIRTSGCMWNAAGERHWVKFHFHTDLGDGVGDPFAFHPLTSENNRY